MDKESLREQIKSQFKYYLFNVARSARRTSEGFNLGKTAVDSFMSFLEANRLFDYNPEKWSHIESMYDITNPEKVKQIADDLLNDKAFIKHDNEKNQGWRSGAISHYVCFINARSFFRREKNEANLSNNIIKQPLQQIFYGAPGTGKSHKIKDDTDVKAADEKNLVFRTTFHPDSDYSTFVGCYKPTTSKSGIRGKQPILDYDSLVDKFKEYLNVPNVNITKACTLFGFDYHDSIIRIQENGRKVMDLVNDAYKSNTSYDSVVRGGMACYEQNPIQENDSKITYSFIPQAFLQAYVAAWNNPDDKVFLVIEEINRGNCAQIFGDLFQLLDRDDDGASEYPIMADKDIAKYLNGNDEEGQPVLTNKDGIKDGKLRLPKNLHIWATMNTSDQSLFPIDSAFKRRWDWKYMPIANEGKGWTIEIGKNTYDWWEFLDKINTKIEDATYSEDKKLGYFFCKAKDGVIDAKTFVGKVLFYLWNDVFKDTDLADSLFADEDGKKSFDKFYIPMGQGETEVDTARVIAFMEKLTVKPLVEGENKEEEETDFVDENVIEGVDASSKGTKDTSVYSVNGIGSLRKKNVPHRVVSVYVEKNPDMTATEIVRAWNALGTMVTVVLSEDEYNRKKEKTSDSIFETRYNEIRLNNGEKIYVFNQFNPERINDFVSKVNAQSWGIRIEKVEE